MDVAGVLKVLLLSVAAGTLYTLGFILIGLLLWHLSLCFFHCCLFLCDLHLRLRRYFFADHIPQPPIVHDHILRLPPPPPPTHSLLPTFTYSASRTEERGHPPPPPPECAICLMEFKEGDIGRILPNCDHIFHIVCIDKWLPTNKTCPLCREVVNPPSRYERGEESRLENNTNSSIVINLLPPAI